VQVEGELINVQKWPCPPSLDKHLMSDDEIVPGDLDVPQHSPSEVEAELNFLMSFCITHNLD
jgi:hypothetical protein